MSGTHNLADLVREAAARAGRRPALLHDGRRTSWAEVDALVDRLAAGLRGLGLAEGDRVAVLVGNTPDFVTTYFGALRAGLVVVPVNTGYTPDELVHVLGDSGARCAVVARGRAAALLGVRDRLPELEHVLVAGTDAAEDGARPLDAVLGGDDVVTSRGGEDLAVLIYTSGTSGRPKGAMLSHRALLANLDQLDRIEPPAFHDDDVALLVLPLFHIYGLNAGLGMVAKHAATGVLVERFDPVETLELVRRHEVTSIIGAPPLYVAWSMLPDAGEALASLRLAVSGAAPLPEAVHRRVLDTTGKHVFEGYGLTETAPVVSTTLMSEVAKPASIGRPLPGVEVRLVDEAGEPAEEGDPGEVVVRGANLFSGYWPDGTGGPDAEGWWGTGDVAYADEDGDLHLVDRRTDLILVSGFNVYPREVEEVLVRHPDVAEAAVIGIPHPYTGESVKALVVLAEGARLTGDELIDHAARSLARFKCPTAVEFVGELPLSATGKVAKGRLREEQARAGLA